MAIERKGPQTGKTLKSLPRIAFDRLRSFHAPEEIVEEFVRSGIDLREATRVVNQGLEDRFLQRRARARRTWLGGMVLFLASLGVTVLTFVGSFADQRGPGFVIFCYGAMFGGIAEMYRGWVLSPRPPTYLEDP